MVARGFPQLPLLDNPEFNIVYLGFVFLNILFFWPAEDGRRSGEATVGGAVTRNSYRPANHIEVVIEVCLTY